MRISSRLLAACAALVVGSFIVDASYAEYEGPKSRVKSEAGSSSFGIAVKGVYAPSYGFYLDQGSLAAQKNKSKVEIKDGWGPASGDAKSFAGSTASTKGGGFGGGCCSGDLGAASVGGGGGGGYGGDSGTSASSFGGSSASASVGHSDDD
jgi:hypothetical protein